jgi:hypothetical protein
MRDCQMYKTNGDEKFLITYMSSSVVTANKEMIQILCVT